MEGREAADDLSTKKEARPVRCHSRTETERYRWTDRGWGGGDNGGIFITLSRSGTHILPWPGFSFLFRSAVRRLFRRQATVSFVRPSFVLFFISTAHVTYVHTYDRTGGVESNEKAREN